MAVPMEHTNVPALPPLAPVSEGRAETAAASSKRCTPRRVGGPTPPLPLPPGQLQRALRAATAGSACSGEASRSGASRIGGCQSARGSSARRRGSGSDGMASKDVQTAGDSLRNGERLRQPAPQASAALGAAAGVFAEVDGGERRGSGESARQVFEVGTVVEDGSSAASTTGAKAGHAASDLGIPVDQLIHRSPMFKDCGYDFLETLALQMRKILFQQGKAIIERGSQVPFSMFFVIWGSVSLDSLAEDCEILRPGDSFGEAMLLGMTSRWRTGVRAKTQCMICELSRAVLEKTLEEYPDQASHFAEVVETLGQREVAIERILLRCASLRGAGEGFLRELASHMDRRVYFPGQRIFAEHSHDSALYAVDCGSFVLDVAGRVVHRQSVPSMKVKLRSEEEGREKKRHSEPKVGGELQEASDVIFQYMERTHVRLHELFFEVDKDRTADEMSAMLTQEEIASWLEGHLECSRDLAGALLREIDADGNGKLTYAEWLTIMRQKQRAWMKRKAANAQRDEDASPEQEEQSITERQVGREGRPVDAGIIGENILLGLCKHRVSGAIASHLCSIQVLFRATFLAVLARNPQERARIRDLIGVDPCSSEAAASLPQPLHMWHLRHYPLLSGHHVSEPFLQYLLDHTRLMILGPGETLPLDSLRRYVHDAEDEGMWPSFCFVHRGCIEEVGLEQDHFQEDDVTAGDVLCSHGTIRATALSYISIVYNSVVARAMEKFKTERDALLPRLLTMRQSPKGDQLSPNPSWLSHPHRVGTLLRDGSIFAGASLPFIEELVGRGSLRIYMPGQCISEENSKVSSLFVLTSGTANCVRESFDGTADHKIQLLTKYSTLSPGAIFGELVLCAPIAKRTLSVVAGTVCTTWEMAERSIMQLLEGYPSEKRDFLHIVQEQLEKHLAPRVYSLPVFARFSASFRTLLTVNCKRHLYLAGEVVFREGALGERFYILSFGQAALQLCHQHVMSVRAGSYFGFSMLAADGSHQRDRYPATMVTESLCQILVITKTAYQHVLNKHLYDAEIAAVVEEDERGRAQRQRLCFSRMAARRRNLHCIVDALLRPADSALSSSVAGAPGPGLYAAQMVKLTISAWRTLIIRRKENIKEEEEQRLQNASRIEQWLVKRQKQLQHIQPRQEMRKLLDTNVNTRGVLKLPVKPPLSEPVVPSRLFAASQPVSPYLSPSPLWNASPAATAVFLKVASEMASPRRGHRRLPALSHSEQSSAEEMPNAVPKANG
eukprot:TRINITY_DN101004_c0_g1_i1.p1 TRINITY_DN101004_c0_g1~~TRINITY_DN101004_c0_g1_i1.p1  ORF type:complete len:1240 (+),score=253.69 TRINITY_DN101004_c0_g1_i1:200-3919(+)